MIKIITKMHYGGYCLVWNRVCAGPNYYLLIARYHLSTWQLLLGWQHWVFGLASIIGGAREYGRGGECRRTEGGWCYETHERRASPTTFNHTTLESFPRVDLLCLATALISLLVLTKSLEMLLNAVSFLFDRKYSECVSNHGRGSGIHRAGPPHRQAVPSGLPVLCRKVITVVRWGVSINLSKNVTKRDIPCLFTLVVTAVNMKWEWGIQYSVRKECAKIRYGIPLLNRG